MPKDKNFEVCVRAIILHKNKVLACWNKKKKYYFFPGGHIDFDENAKKALSRELKEELSISTKKLDFIGTVENLYIENKKKHHEINLVFSTKIDKIKTKSKENHIDFKLIPIKEFPRTKIYPIALKKAILKWLKDKKSFWASQIYNKVSLI